MLDIIQPSKWVAERSFPTPAEILATITVNVTCAGACVATAPGLRCIKVPILFRLDSIFYDSRQASTLTGIKKPEPWVAISNRVSRHNLRRRKRARA